MPNFGLSKKSIEQIHEVLRHHPEVEQAVIYASRVKGNYREGSDIDFSIYHQLSNSDFIDHIDRVGQNF